MDQGSTRKRSAVHNFASTVTKFGAMWEGLSLPHHTKFGNCRQESVFIWSLIRGSSWSGLIKAEPEYQSSGEIIYLFFQSAEKQRQCKNVTNDFWENYRIYQTNLLLCSSAWKYPICYSFAVSFQCAAGLRANCGAWIFDDLQIIDLTRDATLTINTSCSIDWSVAITTVE